MANKLSNKLSPAPPGPSVSMDEKWRAQDDMRALQRAREIEADKGRMKAAKKCAQDEMMKLKKIC